MSGQTPGTVPTVWFHIFRSSDIASGSASAKLKISATLCVISTPKSPKSGGRIRISGIKKITFLEEDVIVAYKPIPVD